MNIEQLRLALLLIERDHLNDRIHRLECDTLYCERCERIQDELDDLRCDVPVVTTEGR